MGQQQVLIILLAIALVGLAIFVGLMMFKGNAEEQTRDAIIHDLGNLALKAREYYWRPKFLGGGDKSFKDLTIRNLTSVPENEVARYSIESATDDILIIDGVGRVPGEEDSIRVRIRIDATKKKPEILE